jgi:iron complex transport system substrate-binding protein
MKMALLRSLVGLGLAAAIAAAAVQATAARTITDSAGRKVEVPDNINRIFVAGPPAATIVYTLAPQKLLGWIRAFTPEEKQFIAAPYGDLPVTGRLTGGGNTANFEAVVAARPDLIVDVGTIDPTYVSLADRVQQQTGIAYVLIDGKLANSAATYRLLGDIVGAKERGEQLAAYAERTLGELNQRLAGVPPSARPNVYYGRGARGLETGLSGSINLEVLDTVGANNAAAAAGRGGLGTVSMEQVLSWNPDFILTIDANFHKLAQSDPLWQSTKAARAGHILLVPAVPWGWFDTPPGVNRLIGVRWLTAVLYPDRFPESLRDVTKDFYKLFYAFDVTETQLDMLLRDAAVRR